MSPFQCQFIISGYVGKYNYKTQVSYEDKNAKLKNKGLLLCSTDRNTLHLPPNKEFSIFLIWLQRADQQKVMQLSNKRMIKERIMNESTSKRSIEYKTNKHIKQLHIFGYFFTSLTVASSYLSIKQAQNALFKHIAQKYKENLKIVIKKVQSYEQQIDMMVYI